MSSQTDPASRWAAIVNDGSKISDVTKDARGTGYAIRSIMCTAAGTIELEDADGTLINFPGQAGVMYSLKPVASTSNTTATLFAVFG